MTIGPNPNKPEIQSTKLETRNKSTAWAHRPQTSDLTLKKDVS